MLSHCESFSLSTSDDVAVLLRLNRVSMSRRSTDNKDFVHRPSPLVFAEFCGIETSELASSIMVGGAVRRGVALTCISFALACISFRARIPFRSGAVLPAE